MTRPKTVLYVQYTDPGHYPPLEHSAQLFSKGGWRVAFLGVSSEAGGQMELPSSISIEHLPSSSTGMRQKTHYAFFMAHVLRSVAVLKPRLIYASDPLSLPSAMAAKNLLGCPFVYHEHDLPQAKSGILSEWLMNDRKKAARLALACIFPNELRLLQFKKTSGDPRKSFCVRNFPSTQDVAASRPSVPATGFRLLYSGSIVPSRFPLAVMDAIGNMPDVSLTLVGYETIGHKGYLKTLLDRAAALGIEDRVTTYSGGSRSERFAFYDKCNAGLTIFMPSDDSNHSSMIGASNKPYEYLAHGLAVLVNDSPDWRREYVDPGFGVACDPADPASICQAISQLRLAAIQMGEKGRLKIMTDWNYEKAFAPVASFLEGAWPD